MNAPLSKRLNRSSLLAIAVSSNDTDISVYDMKSRLFDFVTFHRLDDLTIVIKTKKNSV